MEAAAPERETKRSPRHRCRPRHRHRHIRVAGPSRPPRRTGTPDRQSGPPRAGGCEGTPTAVDTTPSIPFAPRLERTVTSGGADTTPRRGPASMTKPSVRRRPAGGHPLCDARLHMSRGPDGAIRVQRRLGAPASASTHRPGPSPNQRHRARRLRHGQRPQRRGRRQRPDPTRRSGSAHRPHGSTRTCGTSGPSPASHWARTLDAHGAPTRSTTSGRHAATSGTRSKASAQPRRARPESGSRSGGRPAAASPTAGPRDQLPPPRPVRFRRRPRHDQSPPACVPRQQRHHRPGRIRPRRRRRRTCHGRRRLAPPGPGTPGRRPEPAVPGTPG